MYVAVPRDIEPETQWQFGSFDKLFSKQIEDIFQMYDEMMISTSEYWGNLLGFAELDYVNDEYLENDKLQAFEEGIWVNIYIEFVYTIHLY